MGDVAAATTLQQRLVGSVLEDMERETPITYEGNLIDVSLPPATTTTTTTTVPFGSDSLLQEMASGPVTHPHITVLFTTTVFNALFALVITLFGYFPYWVLEYDSTLHTTIAITASIGTLCIVLYVLTTWQRREDKLRTILGASWCITVYFLISCVCALIRDTTPMLIGGIICFSQSLGIITYTYINPTVFESYVRVVPRITAAAAILIWGAACFLFAERGNWPTAVVILVFCLLGTFYNRWQIIALDNYKYSKSRYDRESAIINYYTLPLLLLVSKIGARFQTENNIT